MKLYVRSFIKDAIKYYEKEIEIPQTISGNDAITIIKNSFEVTESNDNLRLFISLDINSSTEIKKESLLRDFNIKETDVLSLKYPDAICMVSFKFTTVVAYLGPILMSIVLAFYFGLNSCGVTHILAMFMSNFHYIRRVLESLIDIRGADRNNVVLVFAVVFYYWFIYGYLVLGSVFHESFNQTHTFLNVYLKGACVIAFFYAEFNNYSCHNILRNLKAKNNGRRGIPKGNMFKFVSCANYFWELISWFFFSLFVNTLHAYLFVLYSFILMTFPAIEKHKSYQKNFEDYPKNRKAIIPFII